MEYFCRFDNNNLKSIPFERDSQLLAESRRPWKIRRWRTHLIFSNAERLQNSLCHSASHKVMIFRFFQPVQWGRQFENRQNRQKLLVNANIKYRIWVSFESLPTIFVYRNLWRNPKQPPHRPIGGCKHIFPRKTNWSAFFDLKFAKSTLISLNENRASFIVYTAEMFHGGASGWDTVENE